jgi:hypothetical protein
VANRNHQSQWNDANFYDTEHYYDDDQMFCVRCGLDDNAMEYIEACPAGHVRLDGFPDIKLAIATKALGRTLDIASFEIEGGSCWGHDDCKNVNDELEEECPHCTSDQDIDVLGKVHTALRAGLVKS